MCLNPLACIFDSKYYIFIKEIINMQLFRCYLTFYYFFHKEIKHASKSVTGIRDQPISHVILPCKYCPFDTLLPLEERCGGGKTYIFNQLHILSSIAFKAPKNSTSMAKQQPQRSVSLGNCLCNSLKNGILAPSKVLLLYFNLSSKQITS